MTAYYNEIDAYAAQWLRNLIKAGRIAPGDVDERSIIDVRADDLRGYTQCHFFAGIGGWSLALRLAGWNDDRPVWTGSCPCQGESLAGKRLGADDPRHLWPDFFRLIRAERPAVVMGEQVAAAAGTHWLDGVCADLATEDYAARAVDIPACAVDAPHQRNRIYWIAVADASGERRQVSASGEFATVQGIERPLNPLRNGSWWADSEWIISPLDGKARRAKSGIPFLVDGLPGRVDLWRVGGNAISPILAAEVVAAFLETETDLTRD